MNRLLYDGNTKPARVGPALATDALWIRTTNDGEQARYFYSTDGARFEEFGPAFKLEFGMWTGDRLGFFCWNERDAVGHIDVDFFRYQYDGPRGAATR